tara:strand:+ start:3418 stop:4254 length:837 start_codon:yes stop_codon:yes gene_type:complete
MSANILDIKNLSFYYKSLDSSSGDYWVNIFKNISMEIKEGSIIGIAGKSGCGKTTLGKAIVSYHHLFDSYIIDKDYKIEGSIVYSDNSKDLIDINSNNYKKINPPPIQMVFQDPRTSLNMRMNLFDQLKESIKLKFKLSKNELKDRIYEIAKDFRIQNQLRSLPSHLSGGQRRRFGLAKIVSSNPKVIIADEPVASLDVSIKRDIMNVLFDLKKKNMTIVVISHDIALLQEKADFIFVFDKGEIVEKWDPSKEPEHIATKNLINDSNYVNEFIKNVKI